MGYKKKSPVWFLFFSSSSYPIRWRLSLSFILYFLFCLHVFFSHSRPGNEESFSSVERNETPFPSLCFSRAPSLMSRNQSSLLTFLPSSMLCRTQAPTALHRIIARILHPLSLLSIFFSDRKSPFIAIAHAHRSPVTHKSSTSSVLLVPPSTLDSSSSSSPSEVFFSLKDSPSSCPSPSQQKSSPSFSFSSVSSPFFFSFLSNSRPPLASILLTSPFSLQGNEKPQKKTFSLHPSSSSSKVSSLPSGVSSSSSPSFLSSCQDSPEPPRRTSQRCLWGSLPTAFLTASQLKENAKESLFSLSSYERRRENKKISIEGQRERRQEEGLLHTFTSTPRSVIATLFPSSSLSSSSSSPGIEGLLSIRGGFQLQVKTMSGKTVVIDNVRESDTIKELKERVEQREGIPVDQQRLVFNGRQLENSKTVKEYNLSENSVVHLVLRLRGGEASDRERAR
ncbi:ubiquitin family protein [Cystoisospora suis]|uniref:Ubiquitin family protein n=1 Tax=Cystoisospora suis TaxID=483139 RepID=A0A2C6KNM3_9APIC|nr:ubiquitin family protein [Cystoisospora suis]